ncbi:hypothetical protein SISNIDRAFT_394209, partial [Sistotremastrum niveocremeum HHB9708]
MTDTRGPNRGSYIWGRSVHNTRIERLWYDITKNWGSKWKHFFKNLEVYDGLVAENPAHIWLLHYLFLDAINRDAQSWLDSWNAHKLKLAGERDQSPRQLYLLGMVEHGLRGFVPIDEAVADIEAYGVDWEAIGDANLMAHHFQQPDVPAGVYAPAQPEHMANIQFEPPNCPFTPQLMQHLGAALASTGVLTSSDMAVRRWLWNFA